MNLLYSSASLPERFENTEPAFFGRCSGHGATRLNLRQELGVRIAIVAVKIPHGLENFEFPHCSCQMIMTIGGQGFVQSKLPLRKAPRLDAPGPLANLIFTISFAEREEIVPAE